MFHVGGTDFFFGEGHVRENVFFVILKIIIKNNRGSKNGVA